MEQVTQRKECNANNTAERVNIMTGAVLLSPTHPHENLKRFTEMSKNDYHHSCGAEQL
jgi:hypothetical protein